MFSIATVPGTLPYLFVFQYPVDTVICQNICKKSKKYRYGAYQLKLWIGCHGDPYPTFYFDADSDPDPDPPHWVKLLPYVTDKFFNAPAKLV